MAEIRPKLERAFAGWTPGNVPEKNIGTVEQQPRSTVYLLDRPEVDSVAHSGRQRRTAEGQSRRARDRDHEHGARRLVSRADQHEPPGEQALVVRLVHLPARCARVSVRSWPTRRCRPTRPRKPLIELRQELHGILSDRPPTAEEIGRAKSEPHAHAAGELGDHGRRRGESSRTSSPSVSTTATSTPMGTASGPRTPARSRRRPRRSSTPTGWSGSWWATGPRSKPGIRELKLGEIKFIDADGKPIGAS